MENDRRHEKWTFDQRVAVKEEIDQQMADTLSRLVRLSRALVTEVGVAEHLAKRRMKHKRDEMEEPPF